MVLFMVFSVHSNVEGSNTMHRNRRNHGIFGLHSDSLFKQEWRDLGL